MYCIIQEIPTKKPNKGGYAKELKVEYMKITIMERDDGYYYYKTEGKFDRPIKKAYKISIHQSYREDGHVKKKQFSICTVNYYDLATNFFSLYDWGDSKIQSAAVALDCDPDVLYDLITEKIEPLQKTIQAEFQETEEYKAHIKINRITAEYRKNKEKWNTKYGFTGNEYDKCYDVFGTLRNPDLLKQFQEQHRRSEEYYQKSRSYQEYFHSNYNQATEYSTKDAGRQEALKAIYRAAAKALHPDANPGKDTTRAMAVLNDLKNQWGL